MCACPAATPQQLHTALFHQKMTQHIANSAMLPLVLSKPNPRAHTPNSELSAGQVSATDVNALHVARRRLMPPELDITMASSTAPTAHNLRVSILLSPPSLPYNAKVVVGLYKLGLPFL